MNERLSSRDYTFLPFIRNEIIIEIIPKMEIEVYSINVAEASITLQPCRPTTKMSAAKYKSFT